MNSSIYFSCQIVVILMVTGILSATLKTLRFAFQKLRIKKERRCNLLLFIGLGLSFWLAILAVLSWLNVFNDFSHFPPRVYFAVLPPIILIIYLLFFSRLFKLILKVTPRSWLIYGQAFRVILGIMLWLGFMGNFVPVQMTFLWLNPDIIVGITALAGGYFFFWRGRNMRFAAMMWNVFGILLLLNVMLIGLFSAPSPFRIFLNEPANIFVMEVPFIWIPGFLGPFGLGLHLFSLRQLIMERKSEKRGFSIRKLK